MSTTETRPAPKPIDTVQSEGSTKAFLPYPPIGEHMEHVPIHVRPEVLYYQARMAFLPNTIKLYLHVPWIAEHLFRLNNSIMRDERNGLSEEFKYRLSFVASYVNGCTYCTTHHACTLVRRWQYKDNELAATLDPTAPRDEREAVAFEFVREASANPTNVSGDLRARLAAAYTPSEVMEIVLVVGFWKMYNTMHSAMAAPLEDPVLGYERWADFKGKH